MELLLFLLSPRIHLDHLPPKDRAMSIEIAFCASSALPYATPPVPLPAPFLKASTHRALPAWLKCSCSSFQPMLSGRFPIHTLHSGLALLRPFLPLPLPIIIFIIIGFIIMGIICAPHDPLPPLPQ